MPNSPETSWWISCPVSSVQSCPISPTLKVSCGRWPQGIKVAGRVGECWHAERSRRSPLQSQQFYHCAMLMSHWDPPTLCILLELPASAVPFVSQSNIISFAKSFISHFAGVAFLKQENDPECKIQYSPQSYLSLKFCLLVTLLNEVR